jgi:hypothetical protein
LYKKLPQTVTSTAKERCSDAFFELSTGPFGCSRSARSTKHAII